MKAIQLYHYRQVFFFILLLSMAALCSHAQTKRLFEVSKEYVTKDIIASDNLTYKYSIGKPTDTVAHYFNPGADVYEVTVVFKKVGGTTPGIVKTVVDNNDARNVYSAGWLREADKAWTVLFLNNDFHFATTLNASVSLTFTGNKIKLFAEPRNNHGLAKIFIDNVDSGNVDMYKNTAANAPELVFEKVVTQGSHTIKVQLIGPSTQAAGSLSIVHDRFEIESTQ